MKYKSDTVNYNEIVWADLKIEKEVRRGKTLKIKIEELEGVVYKEINKTYNNQKVIDVKVKARLAYGNT
tara:strand:- start:888 stop:1094 length:207 start_codon:yes stop_codon:yes gene_type:complete